jgi:invasion protein IalB
MWEPNKMMRIFALGAAVATAFLMPQIATAQSNNTQPTWVKVCNVDATSKREVCWVRQELRAGTGQFIASATISQFTGDPEVSFALAVPLGMQLQQGMRAQVDGGKQTEIAFAICYPNACVGEAKVSGDFVSSLKAGGELRVSMINPGEKIVFFTFSLAGFTKTYDGDGLDIVAADERQNELLAALRAKADEKQKRLIEAQQGNEAQ